MRDRAHPRRLGRALAQPARELLAARLRPGRAARRRTSREAYAQVSARPGRRRSLDLQGARSDAALARSTTTPPAATLLPRRSCSRRWAGCAARSSSAASVLVGPHRDDLVLDARRAAGQGVRQPRRVLVVRAGAAAGVLRAAARHEGGGDWADGEPVLILDDVFAELDARRRDRLAELVGRRRAGAGHRGGRRRRARRALAGCAGATSMARRGAPVSSDEPLRTAAAPTAAEHPAAADLVELDARAAPGAPLGAARAARPAAAAQRGCGPGRPGRAAGAPVAGATRRHRPGPTPATRSCSAATISGCSTERGWARRSPVGGRDRALVARSSATEVAAHCAPGDVRGRGADACARDSTAWATQLRLLAPAMLARLAEELGDGVVTLVVKVPSGPSWKRGRRFRAARSARHLRLTPRTPSGLTSRARAMAADRRRRAGAVDRSVGGNRARRSSRTRSRPA